MRIATTLHISESQLFDLLKTKFGETEAEQLVSFVKAETGAQVEDKYQYIRKNLENLENSISSKIDVKVSESKAEMIKWMFVFVFTSTLTTIGAVLAMIKFFFK